MRKPWKGPIQKMTKVHKARMDRSTIFESSQQMSSLCRRSSDHKLYNNTAMANPNHTSHSSSHSNSQSPASHQHSQSTVHVQTPTLNINAPQFQSNLHQAPPQLLAQNNQSTNYHTNQQQLHTPPTQPFNAQLPQSFNPMFHHRIFHNIHLLTVHLHIVPIL